MRLWLIAKMLLHPVRAAQARIDRWVMARVQRQPGPIAVSRRRVYIVPTRFGYGFALMALAMLLGAMNYSNSMAFALTFLLAGLALVCMHHTHANLVNVSLRAGRAEPVFAGDDACFEIFVDNPSAQRRYALELSWPHQAPLAASDIAALDDQAFVLRLPAPRRGWLRAGAFALSTEFPLGLFHAWTWAELDLAVLVYPRPAAGGAAPPAASGTGGSSLSGTSGHEEFAGLRSYQAGDSLRVIHWKSLPKSQPPMVKQFNESADEDLWLDWHTLPPSLDVEARLSQLARWVLDAEAQNRSYGLRLPGRRIAPAQGAVHRHDCLRALALFEAAAHEPASRAA